MRRLFVVLTLIILSAPVASAARRRAVRVPPPHAESRHVIAAREAAAWLSSMEQRTAGGGLKWPTSVGSTTFPTSYHQGSAGIAMFYLKLYRVTGERQWLDKAEGGVRYAIEEFDAGRSTIFEWLGGVAGEGDTLLMVYEATGDARYLEAANRIADWLDRNAIASGDGVYWHPFRDPNSYTGVAHGAAGAGLFLLHLHSITGDARRLALAERAWRWIAPKAVNDSRGGVGWKRQAQDVAAYHGWCGGAGGIAFFLDRLYEATGNGEYLRLWRQTLDGIVHAAVPARAPAGASLAVKWPMSTALKESAVAYCHGAAGHVALLAEASVRTGEPTYRDASEKGALWLDAMRLDEPAGWSWYQFESSQNHQLGLFVGTAAVGHGSLRRYRALHDPRDLERASQAADYLLSMTDHPAAGQARWINRTDTLGEQRYDTGIYTGAAGIALFLLEVDEARRGVALSPTFTPINP